LAKVYNGGELAAGEDVAATAGTTIAYDVTELSADGKSMTVQIQYVGVQTWQFKFAKQDEVAPTPDPTTGSVSITKVIETDANSSEGFVKTVELYVSGTVDFANGDVVLNYQQNGDPFADRQIDITVLGTQTDSYVYLVRGLADMQEEFPSANLTSANTIEVSSSTNGDDAYQMVIDGTITSQFGETDIDGTGTAWEHLDSYAERITGTAEDGTFNLSHWTVQPVNFLDDYGAYEGSAALETVITLGNWIDTSTTSITIPEDKKAQGVDKVIDTDDDVMVKGSYVSGSLTFVRPPVGAEAAAADWCPDGGNACAARDTWRLGNNLYFRRMDHAKAIEWCESQNGRLATRQEITDHLIPIIPESEGGNGVWETQLYWPEQASKYWTADKTDDGTKAFVFTTRNYGTGAAVYHLTNQETITDKWIWPMCVGG
jgi:hypothetical protein